MRTLFGPSKRDHAYAPTPLILSAGSFPARSGQPSIAAGLRALWCLLALFVFGIYSSYGQSPCPDGNCTSSDLTVTKVELVNASGGAMPNICPADGQPIQVKLKVTFDVTSQTRYGFLIVGDVYLNGVKADKVWACFPNDYSQGAHTEIVDKAFAWPCGSTIELRDVYTAWDNAAPATTICSYLNSATGAITNCTAIDPKCKYYGSSESFTVAAPLIADFTYSGACTGTNNYQTITFSSPASGAGATTGGNKPYQYSWQITDAVTTTVLTTGTGSSFAYTPTSAHDLSVKLTVTDASTPAAAVDDETKTVTVTLCCTPPTITQQPQGITRCEGSAASFSVAQTGGWPTPAVQWQVSTDGSTWTNLTNTAPYSSVTGTTLNISSVTTAMNGYRYRAVLQSGVCTEVQSNAATLNVDPQSVGGTVSGAQTVCSGNTPSGNLTLGGQTGTVVRWERSTDGFASNSTNIANTSTTLTASAIGALTADTWFRAVVKNGVCGEVYSTAVKISVQQPISGNTIAAAQTICSGTAPATLTGSTPTGGNGDYQYQWQSDAGGSFANIEGATSKDYTPGTLGQTTQFRRVVTAGSACSASTSAALSITISPESVVYPLQGSNYCESAPNSGTITLGGSYAGVSYQLLRAGDNSAVQDPKVGDGTMLTWTGLGAGQYYVLGTGIAPTYCTSQTATATIHEFDCSVFYTLTQGYYGSKNGKSCIGQTPVATIEYLLGSTELKVGTDKWLGVHANHDDAVRLNSILPGGQAPNGLQNNTACYITGKDCLKNYLTKQGRLNNVLLAQTFTLSLNARWKEGELLLFPIRSGYLTTQKMTGCQDGAVVVDVCSDNTVSSIRMNDKVVSYLGEGATVDDLLRLANEALGGTVQAGVGDVPSYSDINEAVSAINESFDEGRRFLDYYTEKQTCELLFPASVIAEPAYVTAPPVPAGREGSAVAALSVRAYPNPFADRVRFDVESPLSGRGSLELYNTLGQKVTTVYQGMISAGRQSFEASLSGQPSSSLIYVLRVGDKSVTGKLFRFGGR